MLMKPFPSLSNTLKASLISPSMSESLNSLCKLKDNKPTEKSCFLKMKIISISFKCIPCHQPNKLIEADVPVPILSSKCRIGLMILKTTQDKNILKINSKSHLVDYIHQVFQLLLSWRPAKGSHHLNTRNLARFQVHPHVDEIL